MSAKLKYFIFDVMPDISNKSRRMREIMNSQFYEFYLYNNEV